MLKLSEVAERLSCSLSNVYGLVEAGKLPVVRTGASGKGYRVKLEDLEAFVNEQREHRGKDAPAFSPKTNPIRLKHLR